PDTKNSDCVYPTLPRSKVVVPGSTMAPFPPVTGPVTTGSGAEGAEWLTTVAGPACAAASPAAAGPEETAAAVTEETAAAATAAAIRLRPRGILRLRW